MNSVLESSQSATEANEPAAVSHRPPAPEVDIAAIEKSVRTILRAVGEEPDRPGLADTPRRVARMYREMFAGLHGDPARHLRPCAITCVAPARCSG